MVEKSNLTEKKPWWKIKSGYDLGRFVIASIFLVWGLYSFLGFVWVILGILALWGYIFVKNSEAEK